MKYAVFKIKKVQQRFLDGFIVISIHTVEEDGTENYNFSDLMTNRDLFGFITGQDEIRSKQEEFRKQGYEIIEKL